MGMKINVAPEWRKPRVRRMGARIQIEKVIQPDRVWTYANEEGIAVAWMCPERNRVATGGDLRYLPTPIGEGRGTFLVESPD